MLKKVLVLLSTYNGEKYLKKQISSILNQKNVNIAILIRDDGSTDSTKDILEQYSGYKNIKYYQGKNIGYAKSFLELISQAEDSDYYAFADQDDYWYEDKLITAVEKLENNKISEQKLYCSGLEIVDENLNHISYKTYNNLIISLGSAIVRQRIAGCTMVFNEELFKLVRKCEVNSKSQIKYGHDGLVYLACLSTGGKVIFDSSCHIKYRRHGNSVTSGNQGIKKRLKQELAIFGDKRNNKYYEVNVIYRSLKAELTSDSYELLELIINYKNNYINTLKLAFNKNLKCGIFLLDFIIKISILLHCF